MLIAENIPDKVKIREVGPRDGLQNEAVILSVEEKEQMVRALVEAGIKDFELTSFVSPKAVPALADADALIQKLSDLNQIHFSALVANPKGAERALQTNINSIVLFVSASESHNLKNVNRSIEASLKGFDVIADMIGDSAVELHAAIATSFGCPFEGEVAVSSVLEIASAFNELGAKNISLGDTTGMATPFLVESRVSELSKVVDIDKLTLHFHNTRGLGLVNVMTGLKCGITQFESSVGGMGGCPFAPGASGNIATEDLVYLLDELNIQHGVDLNKLIDCTRLMEKLMRKTFPAQVSKAGPRLCLSSTDAVKTAEG